MPDKSIHQLARCGFALIFALLLCTSSAVGASTGGSIAAASVSDDQFVSVTDNVSFWERAALPFRVDASDGATVIDNARVSVNIESASTGNVPINKQQLAIFNPDQTLTFTFKSRLGAGTSGFSGEQTKLLVAKLEEDSSVLSTDVTIDQARDLLTSENVNGNATFELIDTPAIDSSGSLTVNYDLSKEGPARGAGQYMFFLVTGDGFSVTDGELAVTGPSRVIGFDAVAVQYGAARTWATDSTVTPGQEVQIHVDTDLPGDTEPNREGNSQHQVLVVYHEETFESSQSQIRITGDIDDGLSEDEITIEHEITGIDVSVTNEDSFTVAGVTIGEGTEEGLISIGNIIDSFANSNPTGDVQLDGLVIANASSPQDGTFYFTPKDDWERGTYRYIYLAGSDSSTFATDTGTFRLQNPTNNNQNPGGSDGDDDDDDDDGEFVPSPPSTDKPTVKVSIKNGSATVSIDQVQANNPVRVDLPAPINSSGTSIDSLEFTFSDTVSNIQANVTGLSSRPNDIPSDPSPNTLSYFSIEMNGVSDEQINQANITFNVNEQTLNDLDVSPSQVRLYRYHDGEWQELETTYLGNGRFAATTPGFSVFAVGTAEDQQTATPTPDGSGDDTDTATPDGPTETSEPTPSPQDDGGNGVSTWSFAVIALLIIAAVAGAVYYYRDQY